MHIQKALLNTKTLEDLHEMTKKAQPHLSFFGCRYITVKSHEGILPFNQFVEQLDAICLRSSQTDLSKREYCDKIISQLRRMHEKSNQQAKICNLITYFLTIIRDELTIANEGGNGRFFKFDF